MLQLKIKIQVKIFYLTWDDAQFPLSPSPNYSRQGRI